MYENRKKISLSDHYILRYCKFSLGTKNYGETRNFKAIGFFLVEAQHILWHII